MADNPDQVLLSLSTVRGWEREGADLDAQISELQARRDLITRRLEAVKFLITDEEEAPTAVLKSDEEETMVEAVYRVLREADRPLDNAELRAKIAEKPRFRESLDNNVNYYYTMMSRLIKRDGPERIVKTENGYRLEKANDPGLFE